jgi:hypothetical protein
MMKNVATQVMTTVNAPYGANLSAHQLAAMIADPKSAAEFSAPVFAFFSEIPAAVQKQFLKGMGVDEAQAGKVADQFAKLSGYTLPLAA